MKAKAAAAVAAALTLALAGCASNVYCSSQESESSADAKSARLWGYQSGNTIEWVSGEVSDLHSGILIDQETGVEYLIVEWSGVYKGGLSVTPLLNADGTPYKAVE